MALRTFCRAVILGALLGPASAAQDPALDSARRGASKSAGAHGVPWKRHLIDGSSRGADGVRLGDLDGDGRLDVVTGWEEGGLVRVCRQPSIDRIREPWPGVTVGEVADPEDALLVDLDRDGLLDVVSCCEGQTRQVYAHWAGAPQASLQEASAWSTAPFPMLGGKAWMYALASDIDGAHGPDLFVGAKGDGAQVGWLQSPSDPRDLSAWEWRPLVEAGWVMSLVDTDLDGDGDRDLLVSDRCGAARGVFWLENPTPEDVEDAALWQRHPIGGADHEVMFLDLADLDGDGRGDVVVATRDGFVLWFRRSGPLEGPPTWEQHRIENPLGVPWGKSVRVVDVDRDDRYDLVVATNTNGDRDKRGVTWMRWSASVYDPRWEVHDISGAEGVKFDLIEPLDLDGDGDLDLLACEERDLLGVFWYENPLGEAVPGHEEQAYPVEGPGVSDEP